MIAAISLSICIISLIVGFGFALNGLSGDSSEPAYSAMFIAIGSLIDFIIAIS